MNHKSEEIKYNISAAVVKTIQDGGKCMNTAV